MIEDLTLIISLSLIQLFLIGVGGFWAYRKVKVLESLPNQFAETLKTAGEAMKSLKFSELGKQSGDSRAADALVKDVLSSQLGGINPMLGAVVESPEIKRLLTKYPFILPIIQGMAAKYLPQMAGGNGQPSPQPSKAPALPTPEGYHS